MQDTATTTKVDVSTTVNGQQRSASVEPRTLLVHMLRESLGLTGTHTGCETGQCGACTVLLNGQAVKSCMVLAVQAEGQEITTIEGVAPRGTLHPIQDAFWEEHGLQCGYCTPGMILSSLSLLSENPDPNEEEIRHAIEGNICRCTGYQSIVKSVQSAAQRPAARGHAKADSVRRLGRSSFTCHLTLGQIDPEEHESCIPIPLTITAQRPSMRRSASSASMRTTARSSPVAIACCR